MNIKVRFDPNQGFETFENAKISTLVNGDYEIITDDGTYVLRNFAYFFVSDEFCVMEKLEV